MSNEPAACPLGVQRPAVCPLPQAPGYARLRPTCGGGAPPCRSHSADLDGPYPDPDRTRNRPLANPANPRSTEERSGATKKWTTAQTCRKARHIRDAPPVDGYTAQHWARMDIFSGFPTDGVLAPAALHLPAGPSPATVTAARGGSAPTRAVPAPGHAHGDGARTAHQQQLPAGGGMTAR